LQFPNLADGIFILIVFYYHKGQKKLKIGLMIWGALLLVGAIADQGIMPNLVSSVSDLPESIQGKVMSGLPENIQTSLSPVTTAEINSGFDQMRLQLISLEQYAQISSITMGLGGVGLVTYGGLAKKDTKFTFKDTPLEILKKRLAKGEISKNEFDNIKQDIQ
jgi:hypothetical protein